MSGGGRGHVVTSVRSDEVTGVRSDGVGRDVKRRGEGDGGGRRSRGDGSGSEGRKDALGTCRGSLLCQTRYVYSHVHVYVHESHR